MRLPSINIDKILKKTDINQLIINTNTEHDIENEVTLFISFREGVPIKTRYEQLETTFKILSMACKKESKSI